MAYRRPAVTMLASLFLLTALGTSAWATDQEDLRRRVSASRQELAQLRTNENADAAALEIEYAEMDIDEANDYLTNRREELAEVAVIRLENRVIVIRALIELATVEALADERESASIEMTREADQAQVAYEATEARRQALREEVAEILNQLEVQSD